MALDERGALGAGHRPAGSGRVIPDTEAPAVRGGFRIGMGLTRINRRGRTMRYRIDREQLSEFLTRQVRLVERLPVEAAEAAADGYGPDGLDAGEREAVWLAAGIATFIGQAIADEPERFIVAAGEPGAD